MRETIIAAVLVFFLTNAVSAAADQAQIDPLQVARGAKAWAEVCGNCHKLRGPSELSDTAWDASVTHMRVRANLPGQVARDILVFLKQSN